MATRKVTAKREEIAMAEPQEPQGPQVPKSVLDFNTRIVKMLKELETNDFLLVLSHPARLTRLAADDQQQQQQQQQGHRTL